MDRTNSRSLGSNSSTLMCAHTIDKYINCHARHPYLPVSLWIGSLWAPIPLFPGRRPGLAIPPQSCLWYQAIGKWLINWLAGIYATQGTSSRATYHWPTAALSFFFVSALPCTQDHAWSMFFCVSASAIINAWALTCRRNRTRNGACLVSKLHYR